MSGDLRAGSSDAVLNWRCCLSQLEAKAWHTTGNVNGQDQSTRVPYRRCADETIRLVSFNVCAVG